MKYVFIALLVLIAPVCRGQKQFIVAADSSGGFTTVQSAFDAVPLNNTAPVTIYVRKGIYREKLHLDATKDFVTLLGADKENTILIYDDHTGKVTAAGDTINTYSSQTLLVSGNNFRAEQLTIRNDAGMTAGQAVAVNVKGDKVIFDNCRLTGFQDVVFTSAQDSRQYYTNCYIEGSTDFIFGASTAVFDHCHIHSLKNSHITAASTPAAHSYGYVFLDCILTADPGINKVSLGRPWRPYASVVYMRCNLGPHIIPQGWDNWKNSDNERTVRYAEYKNEGPGADNIARVSWSHQLTEEEAKNITVSKILGDWAVKHSINNSNNLK